VASKVGDAMNLDDYLSQPLPFEAELRRYFRRDDSLVVFDIGSCEGEDSIRLKRRFPNARVYAFEPLSRNLEAIHRNFTHFGMSDIVVVPFALSDADGAATFHVSSGRPDNAPEDELWDYGNKSSSLLPPALTKELLPWLKFEETTTVETLRLDSFCQAQSIESVDFAYIDVQGAELLVLAGAGDYLDQIKMIWMEVEAVELYANQPLRDDVEGFMRERGFRRLRSTVDSISGDQLYVNPALAPLPLLERSMKRLVGVWRQGAV
jgi:FkbM family methyltransferase